ncbi:transposase-like protein [Nocardiopsis mwathae]|uniref:Transposase-like protein n=1 Tax=Nocardiopsis mwathae TaxID=1472723 RepID=A0A7W9YJF9_9ACTN|nr:helix-turn-helix domain-containing protein [Nocardiopsis mwathae]MBB6172316.1 transposase-like protein [Nocardiopsis mwathae]MBB6173344.1 transposase-like protein [Nocardiopsis mwathae]
MAATAPAARRPLTRTDRLVITTCFDAGASIERIATATRRSQNTVRRVLKESGRSIRHRPRTRPDVTTEECARLYAEGRSCPQIAELLDTSTSTVFNRLQEAGIPRRPPGRHRAPASRTTGSAHATRPRPALSAPVELLTTAEVADLFNVRTRAVRDWTRQGRVPVIYTPGGRPRYPAEQIRQLIKESRP